MLHSSLLEVIQAVTRAANEATTIEAAAQVCLDRVCDFTGWPVGHLYLTAGTQSQHAQLEQSFHRTPYRPEQQSSRAPLQIATTDVWHLDNPLKFQCFREATESMAFHPGAGLPGQVVRAGGPVWVVDVTNDPNFPRQQLAADAGITAAFAFPIWAETEIVGVLEFFALVGIKPDALLLEAMSHVGIQLGRVVERQRAELALRASELRFRSVAQSANDAIISSDSSGNITFWNNGARLIFGYREDEVLGRPLTTLMPDRYVASHVEGMERVNTTDETHIIGRTVELYGLRKDGSEFPLELSLATWTTSGGTFYTGIIRDITERALATEQLMQLNQELERRVVERTSELETQEAILAATFDATPIGIVLGDTQLRVVNFNSEWARIMGVDLGATKGRLIFEAVPSAEERRGLYEQVLAGNPVDLSGAPMRPAYDTTDHYYDVHMRPVRDSAGAITGLLSAVVDVTQRVTADRQKNEFITLASHELNTPIAAIRGYAQLVLRASNGIQDERIRRALERIDAQTKRMALLVEDLLDVAHMRRGTLTLNRQPLDLVSLVQQSVEEFRVRASDFTFATDLPDMPLTVIADPLRVEQVLTNLVENAVKYSSTQHVVEISLTSTDSEAVVAVRDHGIGVPREQQSKVFQQFFRSNNIQQHQSGLGLGLFISQEIVSQHGGRIWLASEPGSGSTFYFSLPSAT